MRSLVIAAILTILGTALHPDVSSAKKKQSFADLRHEILESIQSFYPVRSTRMGIHAYDHRLADYSSRSVNAMVKKLRAYAKGLYKYEESALSEHDRIDHKLLKSSVDMTLMNLQGLARHKRNPQLYVDEAVDGVFLLLISDHAPLSERLFPIMERMKAVPGLLATGRKNIRRAPPVFLEAAMQSTEQGLDFYREAAAELMRQFPDRADEILKVSTQAREAMTEFAAFLSECEHDSAMSFALGKENLDYMLWHEYFVDYDADSLLSLGEALLAQAQHAYSEYEVYVEDNHQQGLDSVFIPSVFTKDDVLKYYGWETQQIRIFVEQNDLITIPDDVAGVSVVETPYYLRSVITGTAYQPAGPFDTAASAVLYIRPIPDDLEREQLAARYRYVYRRGFRGVAVQEAYPGRHLQQQLWGHHPDTLRRWHRNSMMEEGWVLYCEQMMYEAGLFDKEDPAQWLRVLGNIRLSAARMVADIKLHTGQFTYDECVDWMMQVLDVDSESGRSFIEAEVQRCALEPARRMSALLGMREIVDLREAMMERDAEQFSLKVFHDTLLKEGCLPPTLLWEVLGLERM